MADVSVKRVEGEEDAAAEDTADAIAAADLQTTPAQAAGRRTRKPVQPLGGCGDAEDLGSTGGVVGIPCNRSHRKQQQHATRTRNAAGRAPYEGHARSSRGGLRWSTTTPILIRCGCQTRRQAAKVPPSTDADSPTAANDGAEPVTKVARRGKPAKATKAKAGARKGAATAGKKPNGASKSEAGGGGGAAKGGRRSTARKTEPVPSIDLGSSVASPDSLQLKVELPNESEEGGLAGGVKRDYTRRPVTNASTWRTPVPVVVTEPSAASTGELQPGDYIIAVADVHRSRPPIWRIEGRSLLQRFEALETGEDTILYRNSSSFSAWNPLEQSKYANISVRVHSNSRSATVVEVLEIHASPNSSLAKNGGTEARSAACGDQQPNLEEKFEVYLQTLLSHVLDPNFLAEVHRENDEYFLANLQTLWDAIIMRPHVRITDRRPDEGGAAVKSEAENSAGEEVVVVKSEQPAGETLCEACGKEMASRLAQFSGEPYNMLDLQLYHYKYHTFHRCREKIERLKEEQKVTESHIILERCLQDDAWVNQMYADLQKLWRTCTLGPS
ncbi:hypothetical protein MRX96_050253 [Rhipicephalus microplus]